MKDRIEAGAVDRHDDVDGTRHVATLAHYHWRQRHGDLEAFGTWYGSELRPCLLITHAHRPRGWRPRAVIVRMDSIWRFDEAATADQPHIIREVAQEVMANMLPMLGLKAVPVNATLLLGIIREHIGDVLSIPPKPAELRRHAADMTVTNPITGKTEEREVYDDV